MQVNRGLFKLDLVDHHAILGVPLDADAKQVRKRYLKIARKLHPDSLRTASDEQKQQASELLSKLVNPAYEVLSQEKASVEHKVSLRLKGEQLQKQPALLALSTEQSKKVANSNNIDYEYANALKQLILEQYESLDTVLEAIGEISELNAVYVMRQGGAPAPAENKSASTPAAQGTAATADNSTVRMKSASERREELINSFINRAKEFEYKGNFSRAIVELREAVKAHPQNPICHAELGRMYMRSNQLKMAGIHTKRALEIDPKNQTAADVKKKLDAHAKHLGKNPPDSNTPPATGVRGVPKKPGGGLFGGLFGGKKGK
ncbi:J domain-containing protein [Leptothoe sp. PORK10 BA2]|uniref:J domain-containing protein n=1 Tax=Leptothoe sp. PORK10 BA2 TaxID=3110254 RepID=UPI002B20F976|nr:J domain-containing protein [Leptothoe sp. PORK10 BA2]MEA5466200.1 J domain-containing protein [Leptothoe sp. PORK10 BA2]